MHLAFRPRRQSRVLFLFIFLITGLVLPQVAQSQQLQITKSFADPVVPGASTTLEFTITNTNSTDTATNLTFTDNLTGVLPGLTMTGPALLDVCGAGSGVGGSTGVAFVDGSLAPGGSCNFSIPVLVPADATPGSYLNTVTVSGNVGGTPQTSAPGTDNLDVITPPLQKSFTDDPVGAGGTVTLAFTITNPDASLITSLSFSDDLDAALSGLVAVGLPATDICGAGSSLSGTSLLTFIGGSLAGNASCNFDVTLQVPAAASAGTYPNTTSDLLENGLYLADPGTDDLTVEPAPTFAKVFSPDTVRVNNTSTLTFTIDNTASAIAATSLDFTDNLPAGLVVATTPNASTTCTGGTLTATAGAGTISYTGGTVAAGASCTVSVDVLANSVGELLNISGDLTSSSGNSGSANYTLDSFTTPTFSKTFAPDTVAINGMSTLTFVISNFGNPALAQGVEFTDDLPAGLEVAAVPNISSSCNGFVSAVPGSGTISLINGEVDPNLGCAIDVDVTPTVSGSLVNTTGNLESGLGNSGTATDTLNVPSPPAFSKAFSPNPSVAGGTSTLTFTIDNSSSLLDATSLDFTDNLPTGVLVASTPNASTTCTGGTLTAQGGTGTITYTGGSVAAGASCAVSVDVTSSTSGDHDNTSGDLTSSLGNSGTANATLTVSAAPAPSFAKAFAPVVVFTGEVIPLVFTIDNSASLVPATGLDFTDNLPAGMTVAQTPNASTTCTGGTLTATAGAGVVSYTGGSVAAGATCTIQVDVETNDAGDFVNTTEELSSNLGSSGTAADSIVVHSTNLVPSMNQWGILIMAGLLGLAMLLMARRRRKA